MGARWRNSPKIETDVVPFFISHGGCGFSTLITWDDRDGILGSGWGISFNSGRQENV